MSLEPQVIIIGAGLAGLRAARDLAGCGAKALLLDEGHQPGGQYLKGPLAQQPKGAELIHDHLKAKGERLIKELGPLGVEVRSCTQVLGIEADADQGWLVWGETPQGRLVQWRAQFLLLATGAREKFIPFKGWTLPGVISTGAAQLMLKGSGILPAEEIAVAGSGPLPLAVAGELVRAGAKVSHLWDHTGLGQKLAILKAGGAALGKLWDGLRHQARVLGAGGRLRSRVAVLQARGNAQLEEVITVRLDKGGNPISGSERSIPARCLAVGHGFIPNIELAQQAGCGLEHAPDKGGWVVRVDQGMQTTRPGIYAAGEITGIAGADKSHIEGSLAALAIARKLELIPAGRAQAGFAGLLARRRLEQRLGRYINQLCVPPAGLWDMIPAETIICRCEDVTMGELRTQLKQGAFDLRDLKWTTRSGMGICQGRTCGPILEALASQYGHRPPPAPLPARMPVKPFQLSALLEMEAGGEEA